MARIRYLKPDFFKDEDLAEHPYWIRLLFAGLWNIADREGRLEDRIKRIKVDIFPYDNVDVEKGLSELSKIKNHSKRPFIQRYESNGEKYIQIVNWHKHQKPHHTEQNSKIPSPTLNNGSLTVVEQEGMEKGMEKGMGIGSYANAPLSDLDFINTLKTNPAYKHICLDTELAKMDAWLLTHRGRQKTRRFIVNWLNKIDKPLGEIQPQARKP